MSHMPGNLSSAGGCAVSLSAESLNGVSLGTGSLRAAGRGLERSRTILVGYDSFAPSSMGLAGGVLGRDIELDQAVPNGVDPALWWQANRTAQHLPIDGVDFRHTELFGFLIRREYIVELRNSLDLAGEQERWLYVVHPYAVPELGGILQGLRPEVRRAIDQGRCLFVIDYSHEGYSPLMFIRIYDALAHSDFEPKHIHLLCGDLGVEDSHRAWCETNAIARAIKVFPLNYFRLIVSDFTRSSAFRASTVSPGQARATLERPYTFLNFNRRTSVHRIILTCLLSDAGLLSKGMLSLPNEFEGRTAREALEDGLWRYKVPAALAQEVRGTFDALEHLLPMTIDVQEFETNHASTHIAWPYLKSWCSVVSETLFFENAYPQVFFSEKIWKPMMNLHPFILVGDAGALRMLRELGFKTFHPWIDESYDELRDHEERLRAIVKEIARLSRMTGAESASWYLSQWEILEHNLRMLGDSSFDRHWNIFNGMTAEAVAT